MKEFNSIPAQISTVGTTIIFHYAQDFVTVLMFVPFSNLNLVQSMQST